MKFILYFLNMIKPIVSFFKKICMKKLLGLGRMQRDKIYFLYFWKEEINLKFLNFFKEKFWRKSGIFNIGTISYSVSLQPDILQNSWKTYEDFTNIFNIIILFIS